MTRRPEIAFRCPACRGEATCGPDGRGRCACGAWPALTVSESVRNEAMVDVCPACGGTQLYVQRDFNQKAGLAIVAIGALFAPWTHYISLVIAGIVDAVLYAMLAEITICYRCHAHFRGFRRNPKHEGFDLHTAEQYDKASADAPPPA